MKFGTLAAAAALTMLTSHALADTKKPKVEKKGKPAAPAAGKCVHDCAGYATCKGNGSNNCAGKNSCANEGIVPKECSSKTDAESCKAVMDAKKNQNMCTWRDA